MVHRKKAFKASVLNGKGAVIAHQRNLAFKAAEEEKKRDANIQREVKQVLDDLIEDCEYIAIEAEDLDEKSNEWEDLSQSSDDSEYESDSEVAYRHRLMSSKATPPQAKTSSDPQSSSSNAFNRVRLGVQELEKAREDWKARGIKYAPIGESFGRGNSKSSYYRKVSAIVKSVLDSQQRTINSYFSPQSSKLCDSGIGLLHAFVLFLFSL